MFARLEGCVLKTYVAWTLSITNICVISWGLDRMTAWAVQRLRTEYWTRSQGILSRCFKLTRLRWSGHVLSVTDASLPHRVLFPPSPKQWKKRHEGRLMKWNQESRNCATDLDKVFVWGLRGCLKTVINAAVNPELWRSWYEFLLNQNVPKTCI